MGGRKPVKHTRRKGDTAPHSQHPEVGSYTPGDVMRLLNITRSKFDLMVREGSLPSFKLPGGEIRVPVLGFHRAFPHFH